METVAYYSPRDFIIREVAFDNLEKIAKAFITVKATDPNNAAPFKTIEAVSGVNKARVWNLINSKPGFVKVTYEDKTSSYYYDSKFASAAAGERRFYPRQALETLMVEPAPKEILGIKPTEVRAPDRTVERAAGVIGEATMGFETKIRGRLLVDILDRQGEERQIIDEIADYRPKLEKILGKIYQGEMPPVQTLDQILVWLATVRQAVIDTKGNPEFYAAIKATREKPDE